MIVHQEKKSEHSLRLAKMFVLGLWFVVTSILAYYVETAMDFDCTELPAISVVAAFLFVGTITASPVVIGYIFLVREVRMWLKVVYAVVTLILTPIAAVIAGLFWMLTHMCP